MGLIIRTTIAEDLAAINSILNEVIASSDSYLSNRTKSMTDTISWFDDHQASDYYTILSATLADRLVGWVALSPFRSIDGYDICAELSIYVHRDFQQKGIAKELMMAIESFAMNKGKLYTIVSVITANNSPSIALHNRMGYKTAGKLEKVAIKNGLLQDVLLMTKLLRNEIDERR